MNPARLQNDRRREDPETALNTSKVLIELRKREIEIDRAKEVAVNDLHRCEIECACLEARKREVLDIMKLVGKGEQ